MDRFEGYVESLTHDGRGVTKPDGKVWFVDCAIPGETVSFVKIGKRRAYGLGRVEQVLIPSPERIAPACPYFGRCGGCSLQHLQADAQLRFKEQLLLDQMNKIGGVNVGTLKASIKGPPWGYRRKARLGVRLVPKKGGILLGFREKRKSYITNLDHCMTLDYRIARLLPTLKSLIDSLSIRDKIPQVEVAAGDREIAFVLRHLEALSPTDQTSLVSYGRTNSIQCYLQPGGSDSIWCLTPSQAPMLEYGLEGGKIVIQFSPTDFTQVNHRVNELMVQAAVEELEPDGQDRILDLFCGVGNFSLPLALRVAEVRGVESAPALVERGLKNAKLNGIHNVHFEMRDLYAETLRNWDPGSVTKLLIDPPRSGALEVVTWLVPRLAPQIIVYVSCNPATLARDSRILISRGGYRLRSLRAIDMFPHTAHMEALAVFVSSRQDQ